MRDGPVWKGERPTETARLLAELVREGRKDLTPSHRAVIDWTIELITVSLPHVHIQRSLLATVAASSPSSSVRWTIPFLSRSGRQSKRAGRIFPRSDPWREAVGVLPAPRIWNLRA
jgi:hypothetical protein